MKSQHQNLCFPLVLSLITVAFSVTDPNDLAILNDFKKGLANPELLKWPENGNDPCGPPSWPHVFCSRNRVTQIQVQDLGLKGPLPPNFNKLSKLFNLGLQRNNFNGNLPTFSGLSELQFAYLDYNQFESIPLDFFDGLDSIRVVALDSNPFNASTGWSFPNTLQESVQLKNLSCSKCNLAGPLPDFLGRLPSLTGLKLSYNRLSGEIPGSFGESKLQVLWLNDQDGGGMNGPIYVITSMVSLTQLWLHGNGFTGTIPENIGDLVSLRDLNLNSNKIVGLIPQGLASMQLDFLDLNNNMLMGPIPKFKSGNFSYASNSFCQSVPGLECAPEVTELLDFLGSVNYPPNLVSQWSGNDPCNGPWFGLGCNQQSKVSSINLPKFKLNGTLSPSVAKLDDLLEIRLGGNNLDGLIPENITKLQSLRLLDLTGNNFSPPLPKFIDSVKVIIDGNPLLVNNQSTAPPPSMSPQPPSSNPPLPSDPNNSPPSKAQPPPSSPGSHQASSGFKRFRLIIVVASVSVFVFLIILVILIFMGCFKKKESSEAPVSSIVVHPRDPYDPDNIVKIAVSNNNIGNFSSGTGSSAGVENSHTIEAGSLIISVQVLRKFTKNFAPENELGRGGFGTVYKGELEDGTQIAVKRMESGVITSKGQDEFQAEIRVLSKVRHRHLVSLLGYSIEGYERLLVYEFMPQGALSRHLFHWKSLDLEPLSWKKRLNIALDVARGMEYLHNLAHESFIHRDLKSSNILLGDDFRAKVSDFGLVKLAPAGQKSVVTRLAGTFGYLAPEYAVMGKITTKVDVFSYGVVLMELLTGLMALDEDRPEESRYLAEWFWHIKSNKQTLLTAIDPSLNVNEEIIESIFTIAELAGHCTTRDPNRRPDMGHTVSILGPLVEKWKPCEEEAKDFLGIDYSLPLDQMLKGWQESETKGFSYSSLQDSKGSIPAMPTGFAESFTSSDAR